MVSTTSDTCTTPRCLSTSLLRNTTISVHGVINLTVYSFLTKNLTLHFLDFEKAKSLSLYTVSLHHLLLLLLLFHGLFAQFHPDIVLALHVLQHAPVHTTHLADIQIGFGHLAHTLLETHFAHTTHTNVSVEIEAVCETDRLNISVTPSIWYLASLRLGVSASIAGATAACGSSSSLVRLQNDIVHVQSVD